MHMGSTRAGSYPKGVKSSDVQATPRERRPEGCRFAGQSSKMAAAFGLQQQ